jgi:hypothetical protein
MSGLRYAQVSQRELKFLDLTSLTLEEFGQLVPSFLASVSFLCYFSRN